MPVTHGRQVFFTGGTRLTHDPRPGSRVVADDGVDRPGQQHVDADIVRSEFDRWGLHDADDAVLGSDVMHGAGPALLTVRGRGQNDRPAPVADRVWCERFCCPPHTTEADFDDVAPLPFGDLRSGRPCQFVSGIERRPSRQRSGGHVFDCVNRLQRILRSRQRLLRGIDRPVDVTDDDIRALTGEFLGNRTSLPTSSAGNESSLPCKSIQFPRPPLTSTSPAHQHIPGSG